MTTTSISTLRRVARWEVLGHLHEAREHADATAWYELHRDDATGRYVLTTDYAVPTKLDADTVVGAIERVLNDWIIPTRQTLPYDRRLERVV